MPSTTIHFIRHGKVENPDHLLYERLPGFHLSDLGRRMVRATADYTAADPQLSSVVAVYSSPLDRTRETAGIIIGALNKVRVERGEQPLELQTDSRIIEAGNKRALATLFAKKEATDRAFERTVAGIVSQVRRGGDPAADKAAARSAPTVAELCKKFMGDHSRQRNKPSTQVGYQKCIDNNIIPMLGRMKVQDVKRPDVATMMKKMAHKPADANRTFSVMRKMFNLAEVWGYRPDGTNPMAVWGNETPKPHCIFQAKSIPGCAKIVAVASAHHAITGGPVLIIDPAKGNNSEASVLRLVTAILMETSEEWETGRSYLTLKPQS